MPFVRTPRVSRGLLYIPAPPLNGPPTGPLSRGRPDTMPMLSEGVSSGTSSGNLPGIGRAGFSFFSSVFFFFRFNKKPNKALINSRICFSLFMMGFMNYELWAVGYERGEESPINHKSQLITHKSPSLFFYIKIILQFFFCGVIFVDNIPDDDTVFQ